MHQHAGCICFTTWHAHAASTIRVFPLVRMLKWKASFKLNPFRLRALRRWMPAAATARRAECKGEATKRSAHA